MQNLERKVVNEKYHNSIRYYSHSLKGDDRRDFIREVSRYNIYLAAQCIMSSEKDQELENELILKSEQSAQKFSEVDVAAKGFLALSEFESFEIIAKLLVGVDNPGGIHLQVFHKILGDNSQHIFIKFLEVIVKLENILLIQYLISAYNGQIIIDPSNKNVIISFFKYLEDKKYYGMTRSILEKYSLVADLPVIYNAKPDAIVQKLLNETTKKAFTTRLSYLVCHHFNLFDQFPPDMFIRNFLVEGGNSIKPLISAIEVALQHGITGNQDMERTLGRVLNRNPKAIRKAYIKLRNRGMLGYFMYNIPLYERLSDYRPLEKSKKVIIPEFVEPPAFLNVDDLLSQPLINLLSIYLDTPNKQKPTIQEYIQQIITLCDTSLREISHVFRSFELYGDVSKVMDYGADVTCAIIKSNKTLFLHSSQVRINNPKPIDQIFAKGDPIRFRIIGINPITLRLNISCLSDTELMLVKRASLPTSSEFNH